MAEPLSLGASPLANSVGGPVRPPLFEFLRLEPSLRDSFARLAVLPTL